MLGFRTQAPEILRLCGHSHVTCLAAGSSPIRDAERLQTGNAQCLQLGLSGLAAVRLSSEESRHHAAKIHWTWLALWKGGGPERGIAGTFLFVLVGDRLYHWAFGAGTTWLSVDLGHFLIDAIALAMFAAKTLIPPEALVDAAFLGELALDGRLRAVRGILPATLAA